MTTTKKQFRSEPQYAGNLTEFERIDVTDGDVALNPPCLAVMLDEAGTINILGKDNSGTEHITTPPLPAGQWILGVIRSIAQDSAVKTMMVGR